MRSLKQVLEMKNQQIHQQEKRIAELEKLVSRGVFPGRPRPSPPPSPSPPAASRPVLTLSLEAFLGDPGGVVANLGGGLAWTRPPRPSRRSEVRCPHSSLGARAVSPRPTRHPHTPAVRLFLNGARDAAGQGLPGRLPGRARPRSPASAGTSRAPPPPPSGPGHPHPLSGHPQASGLKWPSSATHRALCRPAPPLSPGAPPSKKQTDRQKEQTESLPMPCGLR